MAAPWHVFIYGHNIYNAIFGIHLGSNVCPCLHNSQVPVIVIDYFGSKKSNIIGA